VSIHPNPGGHPTTAEDLGAATCAAIECRVRADWPVLRDLTTPSFRYHEAGFRLTGVDALERAWQRLQATFPDLTVEIVDVQAAAETSVAGVVWRGTQSAPIRTGAGVESQATSGSRCGTWSRCAGGPDGSTPRSTVRACSP
jgi:hypothetical protein